MENSHNICLSFDYNNAELVFSNLLKTVEKLKNTSSVTNSSANFISTSNLLDINDINYVRTIQLFGNNSDKNILKSLNFEIFPRINSIKLSGLNIELVDSILKCYHDSKYCAKLFNLDLSINNITDISYLIKYVINTEYLDVSFNKISIIPSNLCKRINKLNISSNRLSILSESISSGFSSLHTLIISNNHLHSLKGIEKLTSLFELNASDNFISSFNEIIFLGPLKFLSKICLYGNPITYSNNYRLIVSSKMSPVPRIDTVYLDWIKMNTTELARMGIDSNVEFPQLMKDNRKNNHSDLNNVNLPENTVSSVQISDATKTEVNPVDNDDFHSMKNVEEEKTIMNSVETKSHNSFIDLNHVSTPVGSMNSETLSLHERTNFYSINEHFDNTLYISLDDVEENEILQVKLISERVNADEISFIRLNSWHLYELSFNGKIIDHLDLRFLKYFKCFTYSVYKNTFKHEISTKNTENLNLSPNDIIIVLNFDMVSHNKMHRHYFLMDNTTSFEEFSQIFNKFLLNYWKEKEKSVKYTCLKCDHKFMVNEIHIEKKVTCPECNDYNVIVYSGSKLPNYSKNDLSNSNDKMIEISNEEVLHFLLQDLINDQQINWCDHRLKLFISLNIFTKTEECIVCLLKCWRININKEGSKLALIIVSNFRIYITHMNSYESDIGKLFKLVSHHSLGSIRNAIVGASSQILILEINKNDNYKFLICDSERCEKFVQLLLDASQWVATTDGRGRKEMTINRFRLIEAKNFRKLIELVDTEDVQSLITQESASRPGYAVDQMAPLYYRIVWQIDINNKPVLTSIVMSRKTIIIAKELHHLHDKESLDESSYNKNISFQKLFSSQKIPPICCPLNLIASYQIVDIHDVITYEEIQNSMTIRFANTRKSIRKNDESLNDNDSLVSWSFFSDSKNSIEFLLSMLKVIWLEWMKIDLKHMHLSKYTNNHDLNENYSEILNKSIYLIRAQYVRWK